MKTCKTCKHWEETHYHETSDDYGKCSQLPDFDLVDIIVNGSYSTIDYIETKEDFGCVLHED